MNSKSLQNISDVYQERYTKHQEKKKKQLRPVNKFVPTTYNQVEQQTYDKISRNRHSQRVFSGEAPDWAIEYILEKMKQVPNSCNRMGVNEVVITDRDQKSLLGGLLVGGVGWCHRASHLVLLFADMEAYKSPAERDNMPYLDAGVKVMAGYLAAEVQGLGCCFINPNIREENKDFFYKRFGNGNLLFCGALAIGRYD